MKKGLVFDLDGVICDTAKYHFLAWRDLGKELDIEVDLKFNEQLKGISRMDSLERILVHGGRENDFTQEEKEALAAKKNTHYVELLQDLTPADILPGVHSFLDSARVQGIPCAIASASKNAPFILEKLEIKDHFDAIVDPATLHKGKPDPEIFIRAAEMLGFTPQECVGFEDAQAGLDAIKACGMYGVGVLAGEPLHGADQTVHQLTELDLAELMAN